eukprot:11217336-Lingulodinium_polyedra.AAC.1
MGSVQPGRRPIVANDVYIPPYHGQASPTKQMNDPARSRSTAARQTFESSMPTAPTVAQQPTS